MHAHILGIGGTFMGGLALLARDRAWKVTGCDAGVYPPMSTQLQSLGIEVIEGYGAEQLQLKPDIFVIGNALSRGVPLVEAILNSGAAYTSGPAWLGEIILTGQKVIAVAGTHGKTTTTALLAWILEEAGYQPGFLVGGIAKNFAASARAVKDRAGGWFVIEADEYDTAFFDKRSKFVHYRPRIAILNNLEYDHADIFSDLAAIETQFHHLVCTVSGEGCLIVNGKDTSLERVIGRGLWSGIEYFARENGWTWQDQAPRYQNLEGRRERVEQVEILYRGQSKMHLSLPAGSVFLGIHNRLNLLAALAAASKAGVSPDQISRAVASFAGVKRRMEQVGCVGNVCVYDDFAHHPTAIATTLAGIRQLIGDKALLWAVLEPRSNTMKLGSLREDLPASLGLADRIFAYGAVSGKNALRWDLVDTLKPLGARAQAFNDTASMIEAIVVEAQSIAFSSGDRQYPEGIHIVVMSNGPFEGIHQRLLESLQSVSMVGKGA